MVNINSRSHSEAWRAEVEAIYRRHGTKMQRALWASFGDRSLAEDAVAEAFVQLLRRGVSDERPPLREPARWVWRAAYRICAGSFVHEVSLLADLPDVPAVDDPSAAALRGDLIAALAALPDLRRRILILSDYAGFSGREVAAIVGSTPGAVRVHLHRARRQLRGSLPAVGINLETFHA